MNPCIYLIIIIVLLIILIHYKKIEDFTILTDNNPSVIKTIGESYQYPDCIGCLTTTGSKLKPNYLYNIIDDRCVKNNNQYNNNSELNALINYTGIPSTNFDSCVSNYNSMYSSVKGNYIIIFRRDNIKMKISHISIHERDINLVPFNANIFSTDFERKLDGTIIYPDSILNSPNSSITFESGSNSSKIIITLDKNYDIGYINIKHINVSDANTLNGAIVAVATIPDSDIVSESAQLVFYSIINDDNLDRIIYTYNHLDDLQNGINEKIPIINTWQLPCDICNKPSGELFKYHNYRTIDNIRCYKPLLDTINKTIFNSDIQDTVSFGSCSQVYDTRYMPAKGAIIQILRNSTNNLGFKISRIQIYSDYLNTTYDLSNNTSLSALAITYLNNSSLFDNVLDNIESTLLQTTSSMGSKIHINLGSNYNISGIGLKIPISEQNNMIGLKIYVIKVDDNNPFDNTLMKVTSVKMLTENDIISKYIEPGDVNSYTYLIALNTHIEDPISQYNDLIINNEVLYDPNNIYLSTYKNGSLYYQIPYTIYRTSSGRKILAKNKTDLTIINKIAASDAVTLFNIVPNDTALNSNNITTIPENNRSHILNPITARYIHISPSSSQTLEGAIQSINIYDMFKQSIRSNIIPSIIYTLPESTYSTYLSNVSTGTIGNGIILIDLGQNIQITFIEIIVSSIIKLTNAIISLITDIGNKTFTYTISNPQPTTYIITDNNLINIGGPNFLNKYAYPACLNMNICNNIAPNTYYISSDRCFKSKDIIGSCDNTCMSSLLDFTKLNRTTMSNIDTNFISCLTAKDTRFLPGPTLDDLSTSALTSLYGCYSLKLRLSSYTGPIILVKRSTDNLQKTFYADKDGKLNDQQDFNGISLDFWLGPSIGYIMTWFDQSGKGNDAIATTNPMNILKDSKGDYFLSGQGGKGINFGYNKTPNINSYISSNKSCTFIIKLGNIFKIPTNGETTLISMGPNTTTGGSIMYGIYGWNGIYMYISNGALILWLSTINPANSTRTIIYDSTFRVNEYINSVWASKTGGTLSKNVVASGNAIINNKYSIGNTFSPEADYYTVYLFNTNLNDTDRLLAEKF